MAISKYPNVPRIPLLYSHQLNYLIELQPLSPLPILPKNNLIFPATAQDHLTTRPHVQGHIMALLNHLPAPLRKDL
jgi:hypothetical protein